MKHEIIPNIDSLETVVNKFKQSEEVVDWSKPLSYSTLSLLEKTYDDSGKEIPELRGQINYNTFLDKYHFKKKQQTTTSLKKGSYLDDFVLGTEKDMSKYVLADFELPNTPQQSKLIDKVISKIRESGEFDVNKFTVDEKKEFLEGIYQKPTPQRFNSVIRKFKDYILYRLKNGDDAILIDSYQKYCKESQEEALLSSAEIRGLLFDYEYNEYNKIRLLLNPETDGVFEDAKDVEFINQMPLEFDYLGFKIRGKADRVIIDHDNEVIILIDLKTTGKPETFDESFVKYGYYLQQSLYYSMLKHKYPKYYIDCYYVCVTSSKPFRAFIPKDLSSPDLIDIGHYGGFIETYGGTNKMQNKYKVLGWMDLIKHLSTLRYYLESTKAVTSDSKYVTNVNVNPNPLPF